LFAQPKLADFFAAETAELSSDNLNSLLTCPSLFQRNLACR